MCRKPNTIPFFFSLWLNRLATSPPPNLLFFPGFVLSLLLLVFRLFPLMVVGHIIHLALFMGPPLFSPFPRFPPPRFRTNEHPFFCRRLRAIQNFSVTPPVFFQFFLFAVLLGCPAKTSSIGPCSDFFFVGAFSVSPFRVFYPPLNNRFFPPPFVFPFYHFSSAIPSTTGPQGPAKH